jgi:hypothetical protein
MQAGRRQVERSEQSIDARQRSPADQRDGALQAAGDGVERRAQRMRHRHRIGCVGEVEQAAVDIEE